MENSVSIQYDPTARWNHRGPHDVMIASARSLRSVRSMPASLDSIERTLTIQTVAEELGLSAIIGPGLVRRALDTAGVHHLDLDGLRRALPTIEARLRNCMPPDSVDERLARVRALAVAA